MVIPVLVKGVRMTYWPLTFSFVALLQCDLSVANILPRYVNSFTGFIVVSSTLMSFSMVVVEFGWNITSVFYMWILSPNFDDALANASTILWISSAEWTISTLLSAKSSSLTSIFVVFVFALKCETVKRSDFRRAWM